MAVYLLANKALLQLKRYLGASWVFLIGITLANFVFGGLFPNLPLLVVTLPFMIVTACLLLDMKAALLMADHQSGRLCRFRPTCVGR